MILPRCCDSNFCKSNGVRSFSSIFNNAYSVDVHKFLGWNKLISFSPKLEYKNNFNRFLVTKAGNSSKTAWLAGSDHLHDPQLLFEFAIRKYSATVGNRPSDVNDDPLSSPMSNDDRNHTYKEKLFISRLEELREYKRRFGNTLVPREQSSDIESKINKDDENYNLHKRLGNWVQRIRMRRKIGKLSDDQIRALDDVGFVWDVHLTSFEEKLEELRKFRDIHNHSVVPYDYKDAPGLYAWITQQRYNYRRLCVGEHASGLTQERVKLLNELGIIWDPNEALWNENLQQLRKFKHIHEHCAVPLHYNPNPSLGFWVNVQRKEMKKLKKGKPSLLSEERIKALNEIGFVWDVYEAAWNEKFQELIIFKKVHGHIRVSKSNKKLYGWLARQRKNYMKFINGTKSPLILERKTLLDQHFEFHKLLRVDNAE